MKDVNIADLSDKELLIAKAEVTDLMSRHLMNSTLLLFWHCLSEDIDAEERRRNLYEG